jgi:hypothetical protein
LESEGIPITMWVSRVSLTVALHELERFIGVLREQHHLQRHHRVCIHVSEGTRRKNVKRGETGERRRGQRYAGEEVQEHGSLVNAERSFEMTSGLHEVLVRLALILPLPFASARLHGL